MKDAVLADRLISYSDAFVALAFVSISGLGIAAADPDIRCSLAYAARPISVSNFVSAAIMTVILVLFRRWESALRASDPPSEKAGRYSRHLHRARIFVVWLSCGMAVFMLWALTRDESCAAL